jgi:hypothetical protein
MPKSQLVSIVVSLQFTVLWKWEASSKNNALFDRVGCGSSASKGIIFYLLIGMFLIALVEKLTPKVLVSLQRSG